MKCARQLDFSKQLTELLDLSQDIGRDHFSYDEWEQKGEKLAELEKIFIKNWCPASNEADERPITL